MVPEAVAIDVKNRSHTITADVELAASDGGSGGAAEGVLLAQGSRLGGWAFFVLDGRLRYVHSLAGAEEHRVESDAPVPAGRHLLTCRFAKTDDNAGRVELLVDDEVVAYGDIPHFTPVRFSLTGHGVTCGRSASLPVCDDYAPPFPFTGVLHRVVVEVEGQPEVDVEGEAEVAIATQ
jgi:arylsulfatase